MTDSTDPPTVHAVFCTPRSGITYRVRPGESPHKLLAVVVLYQAYYDAVTKYARANPVVAASNLARKADLHELIEDALFYAGWLKGRDELRDFFDSKWCEYLIESLDSPTIGHDLRRKALEALSP